jgi:parvulin-like peptidyl-prolyl isomerase
MTSRLRPATRQRRRLSLGDEDRRTFLVNAGFAAVIGGLVVLLIGAFAWTYYEQNLRPVARVGNVELRPDMVLDRLELLRLRIDREQRRLRQAVVDGEIDTAIAAQRTQALQAELDELEAQSEEGLIDLIFQAQLAAERDITISEADIDARLAEESAGVERRHVHVIAVEPETTDDELGPTYSERNAARERAAAALAELAAGRPFAEVAAEYSTDPSAANGGDLGLISRSNSLDETLLEEAFKLAEGGTTDVVRGQDATYRIAHVSQVQLAAQEQGFLNDVLDQVSRERYRQFLGWEVAADRLRESVIAELLGGAVEQLHLAHIRIDTADETGDEPNEGEVYYSEILFAPNDRPEDAPDLPADDPAWAAAEADAEAFHEELMAIVDPLQRLERFRAIAREVSDSSITAADGGDAGFVTRGLLPEEVAVALFDTEHQPDTLLEPVRSESAWYLLWFHERRKSPTERLADLQAALAQPDADFAALVTEYSDDEQSRDDGGDIGWWTRAMLDQVDAELADKLYALAAPAVSEPVELGNATHVFKILEKTQRDHDADQVWFLRSDAFESWYSDRKDEAEANDVIVRADEVDDPGIDIPTDVPTESPVPTSTTSPTFSVTPSATLTPLPSGPSLSPSP